MKTIIYFFKKLQLVVAFFLASFLMPLNGNASIVYYDITPDSVFFLQEIPFTLLTGSHVDIDFNNDAVTDCSFGWITLISGFGGDDWAVFMESGDNNTTEFKMDLSLPMSNGAYFVRMLNFGDTINGTGDWSALSPLLGDENESNFADQGLKYIGVKFIIGGSAHYGWIQVLVNTTGVKSVTVTGYAYETVSHAAILAGHIVSGPNIFVDSIEVTSAGGDTLIDTIGDSLQMIASVLPLNATDTTVNWSVNPISGSASINSSGVLIAIENGTVEVIATANDISGVSGSMLITIDDPTMGISDEQGVELVIYPNPVKDKLFVESLSMDLKRVRVFTVDGRLVYHRTIQAAKIELNVKGWSRGSYIIELTTQDNQIVKEKLVY